MNKAALFFTAKALSSSPKGILRLDGSLANIEKRFRSVNLVSTLNRRKQFREILIETPLLNKYISGVLIDEEFLYEETGFRTRHAYPVYFDGLITGIRADIGRLEMPEFPGEEVTEGVDGLEKRLEMYRGLGVRFASWKAAFDLSETHPSDACIHLNVALMARFASIAQKVGMVPLLHVEVRIEDEHHIADVETAMNRVLSMLYAELALEKVWLKGTLLQMNTFLPCSCLTDQGLIELVAETTYDCLKAQVPENVPGVFFLCGGQPVDRAAKVLGEVRNLAKDAPWSIGFSYDHALQQPAIEAWQGKLSNRYEAQCALYHAAQVAAGANATALPAYQGKEKVTN